jgi:polyisoprenoid-binding protein YceI
VIGTHDRCGPMQPIGEEHAMTDTAATPIPGTWALDTMHSDVGFTVRHMMVGRVRGRFRALDGTATVAEDPLASSIEVVIDARSFESGSDLRDRAVLSDEFLDVEAFPALRFRSTGIRPAADGYVMSGDLTIRDVTRPIDLEFTYNGAVRDPFGKDRIGVSAKGAFERSDYGLTTNMPLDGGGVVVGPTISVDLEVQFTRNGE